MKKKLVFLSFGFSGAAALIYEVTWTRALSLVFGSTTYALSSMLATFMAGLAIGGYIGGKLADRSDNPVRLFGLCEAGIGIFCLLTIPMIYALPPVYLNAYKAFHMSRLVFLTFQLLLSAAIMIIPTTLMGITFPLVSRAVTSDIDEMGRKVGNAYAVNTFGAIVGALSGGFILIPEVGIKMAAFAAAGINLIIAILIISLFSNQRRLIALICVLFAAAGAVTVNAEEKTTFITFYTVQRLKNMPGGEDSVKKGGREFYNLLYYKEAPEGSVRFFRDREGYLILQTGGKLEGTGREDMNSVLLLAYLPIGSHKAPSSFLVVGLGVGVTLAAAKQHVADVDVVEINPAVVEGVGIHGAGGIFEGVDVHIDNARRHLSITDKKYDVISSEPSYPAESAIANLFTREYYEIAKKRLNPGGIYCQWLPYYFLSDDDATMMLRTFGSVFKYVYLWKVEGFLDLIMLGSEEPFSFNKEEIIERVKLLNKEGFPLRFSLSREPWQVADEISRMANIPVNTDDLPHLEFSTVKNIITGLRN